MPKTEYQCPRGVFHQTDMENKMKSSIIPILLFTIISSVGSECINGCNGHGKCTPYDMCICNRNWQAADCSERTCQFGLAHVDTPKGDLDMSGDITGPDESIIVNSFMYPYGTTEQFPPMEDSDFKVLPETAHFYMECSNKGVCDRETGECVCHDGFEGGACQRTTCPGYPNDCSGHGTCRTKQQLAWNDYNNIYKLWDKDMTRGCQCDKGYYGPDCSLRTCKRGVDPMYIDDVATVRYPTFDVAILTTAATADFSDGFVIPGTGYWALRVFDATGEDWITKKLPAGASCEEVVTALEEIPNAVIPAGYTYCTYTEKTDVAQSDFQSWDAQHPLGTARPYHISYNISIWEAETSSAFGDFSEESDLAPAGSSALLSGGDSSSTHLTGYIYRLKFYGNPGYMREPEIEIYFDGKRPSLTSPSGKLLTRVWTDGQQGESLDYFADHCDKVTVTIEKTGSGDSLVHYLGGLDASEIALLKTCLGDSDFDTSNNVDVYNWDHGTEYYPHLIKLVRSVTVYTDGGYYAVLWWDTSFTLYDNGLPGIFRMLNPLEPLDLLETNNYEVYTTRGTLALTTNHSEVIFSFASHNVFMVNSTFDSDNTPFDGDLSCEIGDNNAYKLQYMRYCVNKTDLLLFLNWNYPEFNPAHQNIYTVERMIQRPVSHFVRDKDWTNAPAIPQLGKDLHYLSHVLNTDIATNWAASGSALGQFRVYKFMPAAESTFNLVSECSNRGICQTKTGICKCFPGYTRDDCSVQDAIAL